jgi:hypothetical protein
MDELQNMQQDDEEEEEEETQERKTIKKFFQDKPLNQFLPNLLRNSFSAANTSALGNLDVSGI